MMNKENVSVAGAMARVGQKGMSKGLRSRKKGVFGVADTKTSWKQAVSLKRQAGQPMDRFQSQLQKIFSERGKDSRIFSCISTEQSQSLLLRRDDHLHFEKMPYGIFFKFLF